MKYTISLATLLLFAGALCAQDTLRIATYNTLNFGGAPPAERLNAHKLIISALKPDVLVTQEMASADGAVLYLNTVCPQGYAMAPFNDGFDTDNAAFYNPAKVRHTGSVYYPTVLRDIAEYTFVTVHTNDTFRVYSMHLKANQDQAAQRKDEVTGVTTMLLNSAPTLKYILAGDMNVYSSDEAAYRELNRVAVDPGPKWQHADTSYGVFTQSTRFTNPAGGCSGGSTGGMDDRFDLMMFSGSVGRFFVNGSYKAFGNDAQNRTNSAINAPLNSAISGTLADALFCASDHLPVSADFIFKAKSAVPDTPPPADNVLHAYPNPAGDQLTIHAGPHLPLVTISNVLGQICMQEKPAESVITLDIRGLPPGTYFITAGSLHTTCTVAR